jgi:hypothetical protein
MKSKTFFKIFYYQKYLGWFLIVCGIPVFIDGSSLNSELPLLFGLFALLTSREKTEDERITQFKIFSVYAGFVLAYWIKLVWSGLFSRHFIGVELVDIDHFMIMVMAISLIVYYLSLYLSSRGSKDEEHHPG